MKNSLRLSVGALALLAAAACSRSAEQPALSDDLKADLATVGGSGEVQLAGAAQPKLEFVTAAERPEAPTPSPKAKSVSRAPSNNRGVRAPVKSVKHDVPAPAEPSVQAEDVAPAEQPKAEPMPEPVYSPRPSSAPLPSTQREPRGGWKTPGQVIRNAPFPINP